MFTKMILKAFILNLIYFLYDVKSDYINIQTIDDEFSPQARVIGGVEAVPNTTPYAATLLLRNRKGYTIFCAGSIITSSWVLTAAHCLVLSASRIHVAAGRHHANIFENSTQLRRADFYLAHEEFEGIGPFDVGMMHVSRPFEFGDYVQPVILNNKVVDINSEATIYGWGSISKTTEREFPKFLHMANLTIFDNEVCESYYFLEIDDGNICAGDADENKGGCVGDSGGPLIQNDTLVGVVSWGPMTCNPNDGPTLFTRVSSYITWIKDNLGEVANELIVIE